MYAAAVWRFPLRLTDATTPGVFALSSADDRAHTHLRRRRPVTPAVCLPPAPVDRSLRVIATIPPDVPIRLFASGEVTGYSGRPPTSTFGVDERTHLCLVRTNSTYIFWRILYGAVSLSIGIIGILISTIIGMIVGGIAGYFGGATDFLLMRTVEVLLALPSLYFILILRQLLGMGMSSTQIYFIIVIILAFVGWATEARVIRGMVMSLKEKEYVIAARAMGFSNSRIIVRHILPNTLSFVIVTATLSVPFFILGEVALSFLGVGIQEPEASWGNMLVAAQNNRQLIDFPWVLIPGVFIFLAVMAWNFLGDGLRDAADPRTLS